MLEKPNLADEKIMALLRYSYAIPVSAIEFLPIGNDASAWVYRVDAGVQRYFLKVKRGAVYEAGLLVPHYLKDRGLEQVVAPIPNRANNLWTEVDDFALILYPFIDGHSGMDSGLTESQWPEFGTVLRQIHATALPPELLAHIPRENFVPNPKWMSIIRSLQTKSGANEFENVFERELAGLWVEKREAIGAIADRSAALGRMLKKRSLSFILCHADIHTANVLINARGQLFIVD